MSNKLVFACIVSLMISGLNSSAQEIKKNSISGNVLGICALAGVSYDRILFDRLMAEIGIGAAGIGAGITYYPWKTNLGQVCPYSGLKSTLMALVDVGAGVIAYVPFGITYFSKWRLNFGLDIGPAFGNWKYMDRNLDPMDPHPDDPERIRVWGNFKVGIRF